MFAVSICSVFLFCTQCIVEHGESEMLMSIYSSFNSIWDVIGTAIDWISDCKIFIVSHFFLSPSFSFLLHSFFPSRFSDLNIRFVKYLTVNGKTKKIYCVVTRNMLIFSGGEANFKTHFHFNSTAAITPNNFCIFRFYAIHQKFVDFLL